jgi:hypothetical protein
MGWTYLYKQVRDVKAYLEGPQGIFRCSTPGYSYTVVDSAMVGSTYYAAVRHVTPEQPAGYVFGAIVLTRNPASGFGWKDMDESMGPYEVACPLRILNKLTPIENMPGGAARNDYAAQWRENVRQYHRDRAGRTATAKAFRAGDMLRLPEPIRFRSGLTADTFTVQVITRQGRKQTIYTTPGGSWCRIPQRLLAGAVKLA